MKTDVTLSRKLARALVEMLPAEYDALTDAIDEAQGADDPEDRVVTIKILPGEIT